MNISAYIKQLIFILVVRKRRCVVVKSRFSHGTVMEQLSKTDYGEVNSIWGVSPIMQNLRVVQDIVDG